MSDEMEPDDFPGDERVAELNFHVIFWTRNLRPALSQAMLAGGRGECMDLDKIEAVAQTEMGDRQDLRFREPGWIYYHGRRTGRIALHIADTLESEAGRDILYVAGLFHDIGKGRERHNEAGADITRELLSALVPADQLDVICQAIRGHNQRTGSREWPEFVKIVQDADLVDHVGVIDVWMACYWSGSHGETMQDQIRFFQSDDCRRLRESLRSHLNFDASRRMLEERIAWSDRFFSELHRVYFDGV